MMLALLPGPVLAEVCAQTRPAWNGAPVGPLEEALFLFSTPAALALVLASLVAARWRHQWGALAVVVLWTGLVSMVSMADPTGVRDAATAEGCIGSATLFIAAVAAICVAMILYTTPRAKQGDQPD